MANPIYVDCPDSTWTKVATGVKSGTLTTIDTVSAGPKYLFVRVDTGAVDIWSIVNEAVEASDVWLRWNTAADLIDPLISANRAAAIIAGNTLYTKAITIPQLSLVEDATSKRTYLDRNNSLNVSTASDIWVYSIDFAGRVLVDMS